MYRRQADTRRRKFESGYKLPPKTDAQRQKISESLIGRFAGKDNPFYGKTHTPETVDKIRLSNLSKPIRSSSGYKGVSLQRDRNQYRAQLWHMGKRFHMGYFDSAEDAAHVVNEKLLELYGNNAVLNIIPQAA
jgi:hypothetical protein